MTGAYIRIVRDGKAQNIEIENLTEEELEQFALDHPDQGWSWAKSLAKWIRENVRYLI